MDIFIVLIMVVLIVVYVNIYQLYNLNMSSLCACVQPFSRVCLFATPWTVACQAPLSMGFSQQEYWSELPFPPPDSLPLSHLGTHE